MVLVKDVDYPHVEAQFHEAVFTHASTSPNQQLIASLDVARRQMELEGYGLVMNAIEIALDIRRESTAPADLEVLPRARCRRDDPGRVPRSGLRRLPRAGQSWADHAAQHARGRVLPRPHPHDAGLRHGRLRRHAVQGPAGSEYNIQLNKTSRNTVLLQSNINNTRSDVAHLISVLLEICSEHR